MHHFGRQLFDALHKSGTGFLAFFNLGKLVFPFAGKFRTGQVLDFHRAGDLNQAKRLAGRNQFFAVPNHVFVRDKLFDDGRPSRWSSHAAVFHRIGEFVVFDEFSRILHHGEQCAFGVARRRIGVLCGNFEFLGLRLAARIDGRDVRFVIRCFSIDFFESRIFEDFAFGQEFFAFDFRDAGRVQVFRGRVEYGDETLANHRVYFKFRFGERFHFISRRDDGEVVRNFGIVENARIFFYPVVVERFVCKGSEIPFHRGEGLFYSTDVIFGEGAAVGSRIRGELVPLVKRLGDGKRRFGAESEAIVRFSLESCQVVKRSAFLKAGFGRFGNGSRFFLAFLDDFLRPIFFPDSIFVRFQFRVNPFALIFRFSRQKRSFDCPIGSGNKVVPFFFPVYNHCKGRRLNATAGSQLESAKAVVVGRQSARTVDAHEPIRERAASSRFRISSWVRRCSKASRMEAWVILCIHRRRIFFPLSPVFPFSNSRI